MFGVLTANNLAIGLALAEICCRTFGQQQWQEHMACPKSVKQSLFNIVP
jgi:hypothetical protein